MFLYYRLKNVKTKLYKYRLTLQFIILPEISIENEQKKASMRPKNYFLKYISPFFMERISNLPAFFKIFNC
jgi:hypothetical protein